MSTKNYPEFVADVASNPIDQIKQYKSSGRGVLGYTCTYVPEEILDAAGFIPVRLLGRAQNIQKADRFFQTYCCSQIRSLMEDFLNDAYIGLDGVIFAHTCDSMQSFHDIFRKNYPDMFVKNMNFPTRIEGEAALKYAQAEMRRFAKSIEDFAGKPISKEALAESVAVYNKTRELLGKLYDMHRKYPEKISSATLLHSVLAAVYLNKRELNGMLTAFLGTFDESKEEDHTKKRLLLVGNININDEIYNLADEFGAMIADDDMCTGHRYFSTLVEEPTIEGITLRYFNRPHCAAKHRDVHSRERYILELAEKHKADAVIFLYLKFCDPHSFDYPDIRKALDKKGIPTQLIETEQAVMPSGQLRTKMQAFMEMLG